MRTTVNIADGLLETVKQRARERGATLGDVIELALQQYLLTAEAEPIPAPGLAVFDRGGGIVPGVDLGTNAGLHEVMSAEEDATQIARDRSRERS